MTVALASPSNPMENTSTSATTASTRAEPAINQNNIGLSDEAALILEARQLDVELAARLGWRSGRASNAGEVVIEIPYLVNEEEVNCKTRTIRGEKKFYQKKDAQKVFYNYAAIEAWQQSVDAGTNDDLLICEGEMDALTAIQCGYLAVSVPDGAPAKRIEREDGGEEHSAKYSFIDRSFPKKGNIIICADGDAAGANLLHDLAERFGKHRCKWLRYPKGCKDLNEVICRYGRKGVDVTISKAEWFKVDGVYRMSQLPPEPEQDIMPCDILPHNLRTGEVSIWTGIPGFGKTTLLNSVTFKIAQNSERSGSNLIDVAYASFEQPPQGEHKDNLRTLYMRCPVAEATDQMIRDADDWIDRRFSFIVPDIDKDEDADLTWLFDKMLIATARYGTKLFVIDPWNELDHAYDSGEMNKGDYTGFAIKQFIRFARRHRIHVAIVAHPAKLKKDRFGHYPIPGLYDIADSAHWYNKPHLGIIVHRKQGLTMVRVEKSKYQDEAKIGPTGDYWLEFDLRTKQYTPTAAPVRLPKMKKEKKQLKKLNDDENPEHEEGI